MTRPTPEQRLWLQRVQNWRRRQHAREDLIAVLVRRRLALAAILCRRCDLCVLRRDGTCYVCDGPKENTP